MSKVCEKCGKGPTTGHNVSHSKRRTKRRFMPNLIIKRISDEKSGGTVKVKMCAKCLRSSLKTK